MSTGEPLALDCGGDCWGCVSSMEADMLGVPVEEYRKNPGYYLEKAARQAL